MGQTESGQRRVEHLEDALKTSWPSTRTFSSAVTLFEFPGVQTAMSGQAEIDAVMTDQLLRRALHS